MRKVIAILLALSMLLALTACGGKENITDLAEKAEQQLAQQEDNKTGETGKPDPETSKEKPKTEKEPQKEETEESEEEPPVDEPISDPEPSQSLDTYNNPCDHPHEGADLTVWDGMYRAKLPQGDDEETWLQITGYNDHIVLEYHGMIEGSVYRFWAEEFWPAEGWYTSTNANSVTGKSQTFTSMAQYENYSELPQKRYITLTDDGVVLQYDDSDAEYFARDNGFDGGHSAPEEMRAVLGENVHLNFDQDDNRDLVGSWGFWTGSDAALITFAEDGAFTFTWKTPNRPIEVFEGVYGFGTDSGTLTIMAERIGYGTFPYLTNWNWEIDEYGDLYVTDMDHVLMGGGCYFWPVEEEFFTVLDPDTALGYILEPFHEQGQYTDQYGEEYDYYYSIPKIYHSEHEDLGYINEFIWDNYYPIVEMEMQAIETGEFLSFDYVDWQSAVYNGILFLHVYAYAFDWEEHNTFYIDLETMTELDAREMLERMGIGETEFLDTVMERAEDHFMRMYGDYSEEDWEYLGLDECLAQTLSPEFTNVYLPIFVDRYGTLTVYLMLSHPAGSGILWIPDCPFVPVYEEEAVG